MRIAIPWKRPRATLPATTTQGNSSRILLWSTAVALATMWAIGITAIVIDRQARIDQAYLELANLTRAYAEHVGKTLQSADQALRIVRAEYRRMGPQLDIKASLQDGDIIEADFHQLGIIGADGFLSHSSVDFKRVDLSEREHFRVHVGAKDDRIFVSKPLLGKATGKWSIQLTRRILSDKGEFQGVVVLSLPPSYFTAFFERTSQGKQLVTGLTGLDGFVRARAPQPDQQVLGADMRQRPLFLEMSTRGEGQTRQVGGADGIDRLWAFQTLAPYGLIVYNGRAVTDVLAAWQTRTIGGIVAMLLFSVCVSWLVISLSRRMAQQTALLLALGESTEQLRGVVSTMLEGSTAVAAAGATMSVSAQSLAIRTEQQGTQLATTNQGVREVVGQVGSTTEHVARVDERCTALREQTRSGVSVVARGVEAIEGIAARTREMGEAVSMIEAIAFQTNILALNAAVEAARAGDAGRAFAVVAGEVRELAARSRKSAQQVRDLIARATEQAATGVREASSVREVLDGINHGVEAVADDMRAVAAESVNQSASLQRVMRGLDDLAELTRSNADMVAESVMAAEDMREHAQRLRQVVGDIEQSIDGHSPVADAAPLLPRAPVQARADPTGPTGGLVRPTSDSRPAPVGDKLPRHAPSATTADNVEFF